MSIIAVIPSRYASTRLPGKPLADICGKPMIQRVYERVLQSEAFDRVLIATDDQRIFHAASLFGAECCMTDPRCPSGSDRLLEVASAHHADIYVNIQGDEPLINPDALRQLAEMMLADPAVSVGTLCCAISAEQAQNPNLVKVVMDHTGNALYFSRSPIPYPRSGGIPPHYFGHIGVYAYRRDFLMGFSALPYSPLEHTEKLEQLRILQAGTAIRVLAVDPMGPGVDTPEDLEQVRKIFRETIGA
ncbi:MAG: 3-deoxy-manno-octulosonate cytidylyltransferase [Desulfovibrionaceae bacterium]|nr:3-deoxy-manno-octulosonate cytidylyltransferase [Desulfovibrionaceae bacterium]